MTDAQKLEALIQRAIESGWAPLPGIDPHYITTNVLDYRVVFNYILPDSTQKSLVEYSIFGVIFNHKFALALWSKHEVCAEEGSEPCILIDDKYTASCDCFVSDEWGSCNTEAAYHYHLKKMAISDKPITYAYNSVFTKESNK